MTKYLLYLSILIWPFGHLLSYRTPGLPFSAYYLDVAILLLFLSILLRFKTYQEYLKTPLYKAFLIFVATLSISWLVNSYQIINTNQTTSLLYLIRILVYSAIYLAIQKENQKEVKKLALISLSLFVIVGLLQYFVLPDMRIFKNLGYDDHYYRLVGTLLDPNFTGAILSAASLYLMFSGNFFWGSILLLPLALTFSRASYLSFILPLLVGFLTKQKQSKKLLLLLPVLALLIYFIPKPFGEGVNLFRTFSITSRINSWHEGLNLFLGSPILGWGYNIFPLASGSAIDNSFILILATSGLAGFLTFIFFLKETFKSVTLPSKIFILSILVHSLFNNSLFFVWIMSAFWLVLALSLRSKD